MASTAQNPISQYLDQVSTIGKRLQVNIVVLLHLKCFTFYVYLYEYNYACAIVLFEICFYIPKMSELYKENGYKNK